MYYKKGDSSENIKKIKKVFHLLGFKISNKSLSLFDDKFVDIVKKYQYLNHLTVDGIIGHQTISAIKKDMLLLLNDIEMGREFTKYDFDKLNNKKLVIIKKDKCSKSTTYNCVKLFDLYGNPMSQPVYFEYKWITHCDLSHVKKYFKHVQNFNHASWFGFRCHKNLVDIFKEVFENIADNNLNKEIKTYDGCFNIRYIRGSNSRKISIHSFAYAIDLNAFENRLGTSGRMHPGIVEIFKSCGFVWGGDWHYPDPMHFQYCK